MSTHEEKFYSISDAEAAIGNLLPKDIIHLKKATVARNYIYSTNYTEDELISESVCKTLTGDRRWNKKLSIVNHLIGTIRSISHEIRRKKNNNKEICAADLSNEDKEKLTQNKSSIDPSEHYEANRNLEAIIAEVQTDESAFKIINLLSEGQERKDIIKILNITTKQYDTKKKFITRKIKKLIEREM